MTPEALRSLRESRGLTREELADQLGGCKAAAIAQWESGRRAVPDWVEEKMLRQVPLTLPLEELHALLDRAREDKVDFSQLLARAIRLYLQPTPQQATPPAPPQGVTYTFSTGPSSTDRKAAEAPGDFGTKAG